MTELQQKDELMKRMTMVAKIMTVTSLLPLLALGFYNVMCYDDYNFGIRVHMVWDSTHSVRQSIIAAVRQANERYMTWQGNWPFVFMMGICPANFNYQFAVVTPFISIAFFASAVYVLGKQVLTKWLGGEKVSSSFAVTILIFLLYQTMDAPFEGLYWYNGVVAYIIPQAFCFFASAAITQVIFAETKGTVWIGSTVSVICTALAAMGNYITALQMMILLVCFFLFCCWKKKERLLPITFTFVAGVASFLINVLAPGNAVRGRIGGYSSYGPLKAIALSFYYAIVYIIEWTPAFVILMWIAILPILWRIVRNSKRKFKYPVITTIGAYCLLSAMYTPTLYAMGEAGIKRANNIIQAVYYLCAISITTYWIGWFAHRGNGEMSCVAALFEKRGRKWTIVLMTAALLICCLTMDKNTYHSVSAFRSLVRGEANAFHIESLERYTLYQDETIRNVVVKPYSVTPALFDITDLSEDSSYWTNRAVASYFSKESVVRQDVEDE